MKPQFNSPEEFAESVREQSNLYEALCDMLRPVDKEKEIEFEDEINF